MKYLLLNIFGGFPTPGTVHRFLPVVDKLHTETGGILYLNFFRKSNPLFKWIFLVENVR